MSDYTQRLEHKLKRIINYDLEHATQDDSFAWMDGEAELTDEDHRIIVVTVRCDDGADTSDLMCPREARVLAASLLRAADAADVRVRMRERALTKGG